MSVCLPSVITSFFGGSGAFCRTWWTSNVLLQGRPWSERQATDEAVAEENSRAKCDSHLSETEATLLQFTSTTWKLEIIISCLLFSTTSSFGWIVPDVNWATSSRGCRQPREKVYLTICVWTWQRGRSRSKVLCRCRSLSLLLLSAPPPCPSRSQTSSLESSPQCLCAHNH